MLYGCVDRNIYLVSKTLGLLVAAAASCVSVFAEDAVPEHPANRSAEAVMIAMIEATLFIISSPFHEKYFVHLFPYSVFYSVF